MALEITSYHPSVFCADKATPLSLSACRTIVDTMPANYIGTLTFGRLGDASAQIILPHIFTERMLYTGVNLDDHSLDWKSHPANISHSLGQMSSHDRFRERNVG